MLGEDPVDAMLYAGIRRVGAAARHRPVVDAVHALVRETHGPVSAEAVRIAALRAARDQLLHEGHLAPSVEQLNARAFMGAAIAAAERPFVIAEDPRSDAKSEHYFLSGAISSLVAEKLWFLPAGARDRLALGTARALGVLKECADAVKGTGYNHEDLRTDLEGARSALRRRS